MRRGAILESMHGSEEASVVITMDDGVDIGSQQETGACVPCIVVARGCPTL